MDRRQRHLLMERLHPLEPFRHCDAHELRRIARAVAIDGFPAGTVLGRAGEIAHDAIVIEHGEVAVCHDGAEVARLGPGDLAGDRALLGGHPRTADLVARTAVGVLRIPDAELRNLLATCPAFRAGVVALLEERVR